MLSQHYRASYLQTRPSSWCQPHTRKVSWLRFAQLTLLQWQNLSTDKWTSAILVKSATHTLEKVKTTPTLLWLVISIKANTVRGVNWSLIIISSLLYNGVSFMFTAVCCSSLLSMPFVFLFIVSTVIEATKSLYSSTEDSYLQPSVLVQKILWTFPITWRSLFFTSREVFKKLKTDDWWLITIF